jgi:hypothetical protein
MKKSCIVNAIEPMRDLTANPDRSYTVDANRMCDVLKVAAGHEPSRNISQIGWKGHICVINR